jgi:pimeloyl-ACP methyl ester carboxylesterase
VTATGGAYERFTVPVHGGELTVGAWGAVDAPVVVLVHGITSNHLSVAMVAEALPEFRVLAPDLRGRGRSSVLPGPWGMARHAADVIAMIESTGESASGSGGESASGSAGGPVVLAGHSMGGFVVLEVARTRPDLVSGLVLIDGGLPLRAPAGVDLEVAAERGLGPALQRLRMTFPSRAAYRDFWRPHPALGADWSEVIETYLDYDLVGEEPDLRSSVVTEAALQDLADEFLEPRHLGDLLGAYGGPARMLMVDKGLLGEPPGVYSAEERAAWAAAVPRLAMEIVPDLNHYTLVLRPDGVQRVTAAIRYSARAPSPKTGRKQQL